MNIAVDKEGRRIIEQLCDIALKTAGIQNLAAVTQILQSLKDDGPIVSPAWIGVARGLYSLLNEMRELDSSLGTTSEDDLDFRSKANRNLYVAQCKRDLTIPIIRNRFPAIYCSICS